MNIFRCTITAAILLASHASGVSRASPQELRPTTEGERAHDPASICHAFSRAALAQGEAIPETAMDQCTQQMSKVMIQLNDDRLWKSFADCMHQITSEVDAQACVEQLQMQMEDSDSQGVHPAPDRAHSTEAEPLKVDSAELICMAVKRVTQAENQTVTEQEWNDCITEMHHLEQRITVPGIWSAFTQCMRQVTSEADAIVCTQQLMMTSLEAELNPSPPERTDKP